MSKQIILRNVRAEIILIKTFCDSFKDRPFILERTSDEHFGTKIGKTIWKRIKVLNLHNKLPKKGAWETIVNDPTLSQGPIQDMLLQFDDTETGEGQVFVDKLYSILELFRQKREAFSSLEEAYENLMDASSGEDVSSALSPLVVSAKQIADVTTGEWLTRMDNIQLLDYLKQYKSKDDKKHLKTLWYQYDAINSGLSNGSLITIAATTSGGKSAVAALNLMYNFAFQGRKVAVVSLEMLKDELVERQASFVSGISFAKIRAFNLKPEEEEHLAKSSEVFEKSIKKQGGEYWLLNPPSKDISIHEALLLAYEKGARVILIDYINLLKRDPKQDMTSFLQDVSREAKVFAMQNNCIVILLAQLNQEERVKYSTAVEDNSDNVLVWSYPANNRPGYIEVKQSKARNQLPYNFYLVEDFQNMRIYDLLDPIGLALLFSRASGKHYVQKTSEYFGMKRFLELQDVKDLNFTGIGKHNFANSIDWEELITNSVPAPNAPDVSTVLDMVREMLHLISIYEPFVSQKLLENIQKSEILAPFKEFIEEIDLPVEAKRALGLLPDEESIDKRKQELLAKIQRDLLMATEGIYVEADKLANSDRQNDIVSDRMEMYDDAIEQLNHKDDPEKLLRKKNKRKEILDPTESKSIWVKLGNGKYIKHKKMQVDSTPYRNVDGSPFDNLSSKKPAKTKSITSFKAHWKKLLSDNPPSIDSIKEHMILDGGISNVGFLSSVNGMYLDTLENYIESVGYHLSKKVHNIEMKAEFSIAELAAQNGKDWKSFHLNESKLGCFVTGVLKRIKSIGDDDFEFPDVSELLKKVENKPTLERITRQNRSLSLNTTKIALKISTNGESEESIRDVLLDLRKEGDNIKTVKPAMDYEDIVGSPWVSLFSKPEYIGCITPSTIENAKPWFFISVVNPKIIAKMIKLSDKPKDMLIRSIVWAVVNPDYRNSNMLLATVKNELYSLIGKLNKHSLMSMFS